MTVIDDSSPPALARATLNRSADERAREDLLDVLRADPATRVIAVHGDRAAWRSGALLALRADQVRVDARWAFLGRDDDGSALVVAATADDEPAPAEADDWGSLREIGGELSAREAGILVEAVALGRWLHEAPFCPACGTRTRLRAAGWARSCPGCGREHFPRADPAVIVAISSADGERLLLGRNAQWGARARYSAFAGFVEAGESLEAAIAREIEEEAGVTLTEVRYRSSQAWPYPHSLMLGFHAVARDERTARPDGEEIIDVRWFTRADVRAALAGEGELGLPGPASIAHALIVDWMQARA